MDLPIITIWLTSWRNKSGKTNQSSELIYIYSDLGESVYLITRNQGRSEDIVENILNIWPLESRKCN
jgi:hypothetical protein